LARRSSAEYDRRWCNKTPDFNPGFYAALFYTSDPAYSPVLDFPAFNALKLLRNSKSTDQNPWLLLREFILISGLKSGLMIL
jgi:hypothetical protein